MKFEYDCAEDQRECVAFISGGCLYIKTDSGGVAMYTDDPPVSHGDSIWYMRLDRATRKFYPGDKITITF